MSERGPRMSGFHAERSGVPSLSPTPEQSNVSKRKERLVMRVLERIRRRNKGVIALALVVTEFLRRRHKVRKRKLQ